MEENKQKDEKKEMKKKDRKWKETVYRKLFSS